MAALIIEDPGRQTETTSAAAMAIVINWETDESAVFRNKMAALIIEDPRRQTESARAAAMSHVVSRCSQLLSTLFFVAGPYLTHLHTGT
jgi:hypothetical protein